MPKKLKIKEPVVFFDFDNTITTVDILDDMLMRFSRTDAWMGLEEDWKKGRIGSRECLKGQVEGIAMTRGALDKYLGGVRLDPYFKRLVAFLRAKDIRIFVVSDNFGYILRRILKKNEVSGLEVYANSLSIVGDRLKPGFPLTNRACGDCAHCKKTTLLKNTGVESTSIYIGDGRSDICGSQEANLVFAKDSLKDYYERKKLPHIPFDGLKDVYDYLKTYYKKMYDYTD